MTFTLLCLQMINKLIYVYILKYSKYHPHKKKSIKRWLLEFMYFNCELICDLLLKYHKYYNKL